MSSTAISSVIIPAEISPAVEGWKVPFSMLALFRRKLRSASTCMKPPAITSAIPMAEDRWYDVRMKKEMA